ncbi:unnamed protein product [Parnassius apollo]|uniref:(apollo) hypothetical protein n=1 Tax=Parnassius apollo TaxID=110799 RepID=A0A8S3WD54_PARAO|nr:unnamed protein product [Parnassius apollo]
MILVTLRYYATGSFQKLDGDVMNICQQSVSRIITTVSNSIALQMKMFVKQKFFEVAQFPGMGMGIKKETVVAVICACATLHNISTMLDDVMMPSTDDTDGDILISNIDNVPVQENPNSNGFLVRQSVVNRFFSQ